MNLINCFIKKPLLLTILCLSLFHAGWAQNNQSAAINAALRSGDASGISRYFGPSVDITINSSTSTYSRTQGELVLRDFFNKNPARDFDIEHSANSTSSANATFTIGYLDTNNGRYKVYMYLRQKEGEYILREIRIEK